MLLEKSLKFIRSYNSIDPTNSVFSTGWQHNFSGRRIMRIEKALPSAYFVSSPFNTASAACTQGWGTIQANNSQLSGITASYNSGANTCDLSSGQSLPVYSTAPNAVVVSISTTAGVAVQRPDGTLYAFNCSAGVCTPKSDVPLKLVGTSSGFTLTDGDSTVETYDSSGTLLSIAYVGGYAQNFTYTNGQLIGVADSFGRSLSLSYSGNSLQTVTTPDGAITYSYDGNSRLIKVTYPDQSYKQYQYANGSYHLTGIVDESSSNYVSIGYDSQGRAASSSLAGGVDATTFDYTDPVNPILTDAFGVKRTYHFTTINGRQKISSISGSVCFDCGAAAATAYDSAGYYQSLTDWIGLHFGGVSIDAVSTPRARERLRAARPATTAK